MRTLANVINLLILASIWKMKMKTQRPETDDLEFSYFLVLMNDESWNKTT